MAGNDKPTIIIKKIKKGGHGGHHGGAWKVAYADFVTAMMAFFLLMWLLNVSTDEQKKGLSMYFGPLGKAVGAGGSGGIMGGLSISTEGNFQDARPAAPLQTFDNRSEASSSQYETEEKAGFKQGKDKDDNIKKYSKAKAQKELAHAEQEMFNAAEKLLKEAITKDADLKGLAKNLLIENTPEGLRIQIVDRDPVTMFPNGSSEMFGHTKKLLKQVTSVVLKLPERISVTGYTDAKPYSALSNYSNWELSSDRANATRRVMSEYKLPEERIFSVIGKAAREPLLPDNPLADQNRRISITLLRDHPMPIDHPPTPPSPIK